MTVFEQHIDLSQVETEPRLLIAMFIIIVCGVVFITSTLYTVPFIDGKGKTPLQRFGLFISAFIVVLTITSGTFWLINTLTAHNSITAQPAKVHSFLNSSNKPLLADKYREDINAGIADKLGDYTINNVDPTNDSILLGGFHEHDITAYRDGKNYLLHPHWNYDKHNSVLTITVDVEQLAFDRTEEK